MKKVQSLEGQTTQSHLQARLILVINSNKFLQMVMVMYGALTWQMPSISECIILGIIFQGFSNMFLLVMMEIMYGALIILITSGIVQGHLEAGFKFKGR